MLSIFAQEVTLNEVKDDNDGDSSDSDGEGAENSSDEDAELSFESDDEGNYQQNQKRAAEIARKFSENDSDFVDGEEAESNEEDDVDDEDDEEENEEDEADSNESENESIDGERAEDSDSELSFEESSEDEQPEKTVKNDEKKVAKSKKPPASTVRDAATNGESSTPKVSAAEAFKNVLNGRAPSEKEVVDEYAEHDTDDDEDIRNTVGNIPMHWYDEYKHIGYDWDAKKIIKPAKRDQLDDFLKRMEDPDFWRTVKDPQTGQDVILSEADIDLIKRINSHRIPDADFDDYAVRVFTWNLIQFSQRINSVIFSFVAAMGRMVHIGSGKNADKKCAGSQAFIHSIDIGEEEGIEIGARIENGLDEDHRGIGESESEEGTTILHVVGNGYGQTGYATYPRSRIGTET